MDSITPEIIRKDVAVVVVAADGDRGSFKVIWTVLPKYSVDIK